MTSPLLSLLLAISIAWPAPYRAASAVERPCAPGGGSSGLTSASSARPPALVAAPPDRVGDMGLVADACDLDDAEDPDDLAASKRMPTACVDWSPGLIGRSVGALDGAAAARHLFPPNTPPRHIPLRC